MEISRFGSSSKVVAVAAAVVCWVSDLERKEKKMKIVIGAGKILCYFITGCNIVQVLRM